MFFLLYSVCTVAHSCHDKRNNLAAKEKDSQQKEEPQGKSKILTAKEMTLLFLLP